LCGLAVDSHLSEATPWPSVKNIRHQRGRRKIAGEL
jgi:hypothetical protein